MGRRDTTSLQISGVRGTPIEFPGLAPGKRVYGPLRLLDVKPPCSNLAEALCFGHFLLSDAGRGSQMGPNEFRFANSDQPESGIGRGGKIVELLTWGNGAAGGGGDEN